MTSVIYITLTNRKVKIRNCLKNVKNNKILMYIAIPLAPILFMQGFQAKKPQLLTLTVKRRKKN